MPAEAPVEPLVPARSGMNTLTAGAPYNSACCYARIAGNGEREASGIHGSDNDRGVERLAPDPERQDRPEGTSGTGPRLPVTATEYAAPQTELEMKITTVWHELLNLERVGIHDNFFDLGANSRSWCRPASAFERRSRRSLPCRPFPVSDGECTGGALEPERGRSIRPEAEPGQGPGTFRCAATTPDGSAAGSCSREGADEELGITEHSRNSISFG